MLLDGTCSLQADRAPVHLTCKSTSYASFELIRGRDTSSYGVSSTTVSKTSCLMQTSSKAAWPLLLQNQVDHRTSSPWPLHLIACQASPVWAAASHATHIRHFAS